jgi:hypothetical protein
MQMDYDLARAEAQADSIQVEPVPRPAEDAAQDAPPR